MATNGEKEDSYSACEDPSQPDYYVTKRLQSSEMEAGERFEESTPLILAMA